jgi:hypothetical protein
MFAWPMSFSSCISSAVALASFLETPPCAPAAPERISTKHSPQISFISRKYLLLEPKLALIFCYGAIYVNFYAKAGNYPKKLLTQKTLFVKFTFVYQKTLKKKLSILLLKV